MNALSAMCGIDAKLLILDHSSNQKLKFAELKANGTIAPEVQALTVPEACEGAALKAGVQPFDSFPDFDAKEFKGKKTVYSQNGTTVMIDRTSESLIGVINKRTVYLKGRKLRYTLVDGFVHQLVEQKPDGAVETTDFVKSLPIRWRKSKDGEFVIGKNLITDTICRRERIFGQNLFEMIDWDDAVVFFDGITSAYLAPVTTAQRVLFLHADHRGPDGKVVPRSKYLIENFKGETIITSTYVHKAQIEADVTPSAEVHVIPHFCEQGQVQKQERKHLVTISRLELKGKPIHECIEAFCNVMHDFPEVNYLIYGSGSGQQRLEDLIAQLGCGDRVQMAGYTSEPLAVFQKSLASVYPTTTEGFGLSILEALSNNCPVISYDVNYGPREMIEPGRNGELVQPGDIKAVEDAMRRVLSDPLRYQLEAENGLERYTRDAYLANYRAIVDTLTSSERFGSTSAPKLF